MVPRMILARTARGCGSIVVISLLPFQPTINPGTSNRQGLGKYTRIRRRDYPS
jgi:hypothetical protein